MAAPLGFKTFNSGDVLTAADTNGYLMQGVWTFANAAARTAAVTSPQEGNVSFLKDTNSFEIYDGAAWVAYGSGDITGVTAGTGISGGGTSGTVTVTNSMATEIDAKGDLIAGTGADTFARLPVGTNGLFLSADSAETTGLKWASAASGLTLIQRTTFSNVASQTFDNVFNTTYSSYLVVGERLYSAAGAPTPYLQLRYGSTTQTASYYGAAIAYNSGVTISTTGSSNASQFSINRRMGTFADKESMSFAMYFQGVGNTSEKPSAHGTTQSQTDSEAGFNGFWVNSNQTYTGFILSSSSGNIYGTVAIYGLAK